MELALLLIVVAGAWFWLDTLKTREIALKAGERECAAEGLQFLDWTVAQTRLRLARDGSGTVKLRRT
ncbi:MAG: DUF3301 domain-containing protein, partial [Burkholderiales bacterium]|nr:DUF3301 domain-containing protein [Burkholderiales bacterium]